MVASVEKQPGGERDAKEIMNFFGNGECPGTALIEIAGMPGTARSALHAVAINESPQGPYPPKGGDIPFRLYTLNGVEFKAVRMASEVAPSKMWTLRDWEEARICTDARGKKLRIKAIKLRAGAFLDVIDGDTPSHTVYLVFAQTLRERRIVPSDMDWGTIRRSDLDYLYASDLRWIEWSDEPAVPHMCLMNSP